MLATYNYEAYYLPIGSYFSFYTLPATQRSGMSDSDDRWNEEFKDHMREEKEDADARGDDRPEPEPAHEQNIEDLVNEIPDEDWDN